MENEEYESDTTYFAMIGFKTRSEMVAAIDNPASLVRNLRELLAEIDAGESEPSAQVAENAPHSHTTAPPRIH